MIQPFEVRHILTNFLCIKFALDWLSFLFYSFWKLYCIWSLSFKCRFKLTLKSQNLVLKLIIYWIYSFESESCNNHSAHYAILILKDPDVLHVFLFDVLIPSSFRTKSYLLSYYHEHDICLFGATRCHTLESTFISN